MKKLITLFAIIAMFAGIMNAQEIKVGGSSNWDQFPVVSTDIIDADGENIDKIFNLGSKSAIQYYTIFIDIDTTATPGVLMHDVPVYLQESYDGVNWTTLSTENFYGVADTTFKFADLSTGTIAPYLRVRLYGDDGDSINVQLMKVVGRFVNKH